MNTKQDRPSLRLTSASMAETSSEDRPLPDPLRRALWQQRCSIFGAYVRADHIRGTDNQHAQQVALAEELQRLANEAFALADHLEGC
jgi:hypothetical protein